MTEKKTGFEIAKEMRAKESADDRNRIEKSADRLFKEFLHLFEEFYMTGKSEDPGTYSSARLIKNGLFIKTKDVDSETITKLKCKIIDYLTSEGWPIGTYGFETDQVWPKRHLDQIWEEKCLVLGLFPCDVVTPAIPEKKE